MHVGAISIIDALGFKGIWQRHDVDAVLESMHDLRKHIVATAESVTKHLAKFGGPGRLNHAPQGTARFLSDTIVIALHLPNFGPETLTDRIDTIKSAMTTFVVHATGFAIAGGTQGSTPLNYRGTITWGEFLIDENFLIGPAVDEAAALHERADGAIVDLTDSAAEQMLRFRGSSLLPPELAFDRLLLQHDVPLKKGGVERRWVVNPYSVCSRPAERHDVLQGIKAAFGEHGEATHASKYRNTMNLLSAASTRG
jgi:hypothetical protein